MAKSALARGQADRGDRHRYCRVRLVGGYAHLPGAHVTAGGFGGGGRSLPGPGRGRFVFCGSKAKRGGARPFLKESTEDGGGGRSVGGGGGRRGGRDRRGEKK